MVNIEISERLKQSLLSIIGSLISAIVNIYLISLFISFTDTVVYGLYAFIWVTITTIGNTIGLSVGAIATTYSSESLDKNLYVLIKLLKFCFKFLIFGVIIFCLFFKVNNFFEIVNGIEIFIFSVLSIFLCCIDSFFKSILIGLKMMKQFTIGVIIGSIVNLILLIFLVTNYNILGGIISYFFAELFLVIYYFKFLFTIYTKKKKKNKFSISTWTKNKLIKNVYFNILSSLFYPFVLWHSYYLINNNSNYADITKFNISHQFFILITFIPVVSNRVLVPFIVKAKSKHILIFRTMFNNLVIGTASILILFYAGNNVFKFLNLNVRFSSLLDMLMVFSGLILIVSVPIGQLILSELKIITGAFFNFISMSVVFVFSSLFYQTFGLNTIGISFIAGYTLNLFLSLIFLKKFINQRQ